MMVMRNLKAFNVLTWFCLPQTLVYKILIALVGGFLWMEHQQKHWSRCCLKNTYKEWLRSDYKVVLIVEKRKYFSNYLKKADIIVTRRTLCAPFLPAPFHYCVDSLTHNSCCKQHQHHVSRGKSQLQHLSLGIQVSNPTTSWRIKGFAWKEPDWPSNKCSTNLYFCSICIWSQFKQSFFKSKLTKRQVQTFLPQTWVWLS